MKSITRFLVTLEFLYLISFIQKTRAQLQPISDIIITFNASGISYQNDILFFLYTRNNENEPEKLLVDDEMLLKQSSYDVSKPTKFITHGWTDDGMDESCILPKQAFLQRDDYNVIIVDWGTFAKLNYLSASVRVKAVGIRVSEMIKFLAKKGSDVKQMTLVGHSLGAHVMGLAGNEVSPKVGHIVGLDPASPGFALNDQNGRLHYADADNVEVIHTNAKKLGIPYDIGHFDYWPNGGIDQPGCVDNITSFCSHRRSYLYYVESLERPDSLLSVLCKTYMDFLDGKCKNNPVEFFPIWAPVPEKSRGSYMLRTKDSSPFGLGLEGAKPPNNYTESM